VGWLQQQLQAQVDRVVRAQVGRGRGERERPDAAALSAWRCSRCGSQRRCDFNYSGSYRRGLAWAQGWIELRIPRLRCRCGGNVRADFGALLPPRQRLWYDLILAALELLRGGQSLRTVREHLARRGVQVGLSSLAGILGAFAEVELNAGGAAGAEALSLDAAFGRAAGASWAHLYVHEVRPREQPLVRNGREVAWYQTGKVLAVGVAREESQAAWEAVLGEARVPG
jgi:hypothetical protein